LTTRNPRNFGDLLAIYLRSNAVKESELIPPVLWPPDQVVSIKPDAVVLLPAVFLMNITELAGGSMASSLKHFPGALRTRREVSGRYAINQSSF
jgi:hypothetical protein